MSPWLPLLLLLVLPLTLLVGLAPPTGSEILNALETAGSRTVVHTSQVSTSCLESMSEQGRAQGQLTHHWFTTKGLLPLARRPCTCKLGPTPQYIMASLSPCTNTTSAAALNPVACDAQNYMSLVVNSERGGAGREEVILNIPPGLNHSQMCPLQTSLLQFITNQCTY